MIQDPSVGNVETRHDIGAARGHVRVMETSRLAGGRDDMISVMVFVNSGLVKRKKAKKGPCHPMHEGHTSGAGVGVARAKEGMQDVGKVGRADR